MSFQALGPVTQMMGETLASLYPIIVKKSTLTINLQTFIRIAVYSIIPLFFINAKSIFSNVSLVHWVLAGIVTYTHIWSSYNGFKLLEAGFSMTLFYTYPIMILALHRLFFGKTIPTYKYFMFIIPLLLIYQLSKHNQVPLTESYQTDEKDGLSTSIKGIGYILLAAFTEALLYIYITYLKVPLSTENSWNSVFFAYVGAFVLSLFTLSKRDLSQNFTLPDVSFVTISNVLIGMVGMLLRFFAIPRTSPTVYSILSFTGIITSNLFGHFILGESLGIKKILSLVGIIVSLVVIKISP